MSLEIKRGAFFFCEADIHVLAFVLLRLTNGVLIRLTNGVLIRLTNGVLIPSVWDALDCSTAGQFGLPSTSLKAHEGSTQGSRQDPSLPMILSYRLCVANANTPANNPSSSSWPTSAGHCGAPNC